MRSHLRVSLLVTCSLAVSGAPAAAMGTEFTYQGQLQQAGIPHDGPCDFTFTLFDAATAGSPVGTPLTGTVTVTNGLFTIPLDFGAGVFTGPDRWLEIAVVCPAGGGTPTPLLPRQKLTATPYAQLSATVADGAVTSAKIADNGIAPADVGFNYAGSTSKGGPAMGAPWSGLTGVPAGFADGIDNDTTYTAGSGLTLVGTQFGVDMAVIQARVTGTCAPGKAMRAIDASGNATCELVPPGDITAVTAGTGLVGGGTAGAVTLGLAVPLSFSSNSQLPTFSATNLDSQGRAIRGYSDFIGVEGGSTLGAGVHGYSQQGHGVSGYSEQGTALRGESASGYGVWATSETSIAMLAHSPSRTGVYATSDNDYGIYARSKTSTGLYAVSQTGSAVQATGLGVARFKAALRAENTNPDRGMAAYMTNESNFATAHFANAGTGEVLFLQNGNGGPFIKAINATETDRKFLVNSDGSVNADGAYTSPASDFAEMLPAVEGLEPGDLLAVNADGKLVRTTDRYQSSVVGVYSTKPGFVGGRPIEGSAADRIPLAVAGIVPLKVTAENGTIQPGTLLVASSRAGHAMRAKANPPAGTLVGKALGTLDGDVGMIDVLVTLQ